MISAAPFNELLFVLARLLWVQAAGGALIVLVSAIHRRRDDGSGAWSHTRRGLWRRFWVWAAISAGMVSADYLGGAVFLAAVGSIGLLAAREMLAAGRGAFRQAIAFGMFVPGLLVWIAGPLFLLIFLREREAGFILTVWIMLVVAVSDVIAMFGGITFGRIRLFPGISGGKTLEGSICGLLGGVGAAAVLRDGVAAYSMASSSAVYYGSAVIVILAGMCGDVSASLVKRRAGLKDFGRALPGHGGVMDRLDSLLFAVPVGTFLILQGWRG